MYNLSQRKINRMVPFSSFSKTALSLHIPCGLFAKSSSSIHKDQVPKFPKKRKFSVRNLCHLANCLHIPGFFLGILIGQGWRWRRVGRGFWWISVATHAEVECHSKGPLSARSKACKTHPNVTNRQLPYGSLLS